MYYQFLIEGREIFSGDIIQGGIYLGVGLLVIILAIGYIWHRFRENERLKYEFITIVAHKFRTPLTYVKWISDTLVTDEDDQFKKKSLEDIQRSNQRLIDLTGTLIELTESDGPGRATYKIEHLNLCDLVRETAAPFKDAFHEKNIFFSVNCRDEKIMVKVDRARLEFILQTLFENARNYTSPGKEVRVLISHSFRKAIVTVIDQGIGITKEDMPHVFTKFFRAQNARHVDTEGFGVGLYMAKTISRRLGGRLEAHSEGENKGSTFTLTLHRAR